MVYPETDLDNDGAEIVPGDPGYLVMKPLRQVLYYCIIALLHYFIIALLHYFIICVFVDETIAVGRMLLPNAG